MSRCHGGPTPVSYPLLDTVKSRAVRCLRIRIGVNTIFLNLLNDVDWQCPRRRGSNCIAHIAREHFIALSYGAALRSRLSSGVERYAARSLSSRTARALCSLRRCGSNEDPATRGQFLFPVVGPAISGHSQCKEARAYLRPASRQPGEQSDQHDPSVKDGTEIGRREHESWSGLFS